MPTATSSQIISSLYVATFNRAPDQSGLTFWQNKFTQDSESAVKQLAAGFAGHPAFTQLYANLNNLDFVNAIYQNVLGAQGDQDGLNYWTNTINNGLSRSDFLAAFVNTSLTVDINATTFPNLTQAERDIAISRQNFLTNKADVGLNFTNTLGIKSNLLPTTDGNILSGPNGLLADPAYQASIAILKDVNDTATSAIAANSLIQAAIASVDPLDFIVGGGAGGENFTLTTGTDIIPGLIGSNGSSSTAGDNIISAIIENSGTNGATNTSTLNSADSLDAGSGSGTDIMNVRVISLTGSIAVTPVLTSVETVSVSNADNSGNNVAINLALTTGTTTVEFKDNAVGSNTTFLNAADTAVISLNNADGSSVGQNVNLGSASSRSGTADAFAITIANGSGSSDVAAGFNLLNSDGTADDTSFETANITVAGASSFVVAGTATAGLTSVNVSGATTGVTTGYGLTLSQVTGFNNLKTVNASGMTTGGGLDIDARGSAATGFTFTGSNANDRVVLTNTTMNNAGTLDGGLGKDTLATTSFNVTPSVVNSATGFEVLESVNASSNLEANSFTSINEFLFSGGPVNGRLNITGVESADHFVFTSDQGSNDEAIRFTAATVGQGVFFEMRASSVTNGEVTIIANTNTGNDVSAIGFQGGIASVSIDSTGQNTNANLVEAIRTGNYNFYAFNNDDGLANFTITGAQDLTIGAKEGVDLSSNSRTLGFSNAVNVNASDFTGTLRIAGSNSNDVIFGGSGDDIIYGLGGADTLNGNGGSDQFRMVGTSGADIIKDFVKGTDKVGFNNIDFANTSATSAGVSLASTDYVDNRSGITSIGTADDNKVIELQSSLSTSQIGTDVGGAVDAYVLVFNSTTNKGELWFDQNWSDVGGRSQVAAFDDVTTLVGVTTFNNTDFVEFIA